MLIVILTIILFLILMKDCCGLFTVVPSCSTWIINDIICTFNLESSVIAVGILLVISKENADLHQSLSNISYFGDKNLV